MGLGWSSEVGNFITTSVICFLKHLNNILNNFEQVFTFGFVVVVFAYFIQYSLLISKKIFHLRSLFLFVGSTFPLSALRLLVPPIRLVSAAIWQTLQQKSVSDYGLLEEFVFTVTETVPQLLSTRQRAELILGLRARVRRVIKIYNNIINLI